VERTFTNVPTTGLTIRMTERDTAIIISACRVEGISRSEFFRRTSLQAAKRILRRAERERQGEQLGAKEGPQRRNHGPKQKEHDANAI
jgi:hypothetical protein